jgi:hypothetical protein
MRENSHSFESRGIAPSSFSVDDDEVLLSGQCRGSMTGGGR